MKQLAPDQARVLARAVQEIEDELELEAVVAMKVKLRQLRWYHWLFPFRITITITRLT